MKYLILLIALFTTSVSAGTDYLGINDQDDTYAWLSAVAMVADWGTTLNIEDHPGHEEKNKILGKHPSRDKIHAYFLTALVGHWWLNTDNRMGKYRNIYNLINLTVEVRVVDGNLNAGMRINF